MKRFSKKFIGVFLVVALVLILSLAQFAAADTKPTAKNVILLIGDGMGFGHMTLARIVKGEPLAMDEEFQYIGTSSTSSTTGWVTDSAAAGTALAAGIKTYNGAISVDDDKKPVETILEKAQEKGKAVGLVSTTRLTHATPAVFAAHNESRSNENEIAEDMLNHNVDVLLGGGKRHFIPKSDGGKRTDGKNLIEKAEKKGYTFVDTKEGMEKVTSGKLLGLFTNSHMSYELDRSATKEPSIAEMTEKAIELLSKDSDGFFLMVEGGRIDHASHGHDAAATVYDTIAFDEAVKAAVEFAQKRTDTLVIVTADHETGGISVGGYGEYVCKPEVLKSQLKSLEAVADKMTPNTFQYYFHFDLGVDDLTYDERIQMLEAFKAKDAGDYYAVSNTAADIISKRAYVGWTSGAHTGMDVPILSYGPQAQEFGKHMENNMVCKLMIEAMGLE